MYEHFAEEMATAMETATAASITPQSPTSTLMEVTLNTRATSSPSASTTPPTPNTTFEADVNQLQLQQQQQKMQHQQQQQQQASRALITIATQTALRRQDIPTMYHFDNDNPSKNENKIASNEVEEIAVGSSTDLTPCPTCSRKFNAVSLSKHVNICQKMATKKRKPFDSSRQRREGTEMAVFLPKNFGLPANKQTSESLPADEKLIRSTARSSMRKQSNASTVSNISVNTTASNSSMPTSPKPTALSLARSRHNSTERPKRGKPTPPSSEQCPYCERFFGIKAYDRHVEWCKEKSLQAAIKNSGCSETNKAKERLEARTKYRAPIKTKRSLNREKYAGMTGEEFEGDDSPKINSGNALMTSSIASDRSGADNVSQYSLESFECLESTEPNATCIDESINMDESIPSVFEQKDQTNISNPTGSLQKIDFTEIQNFEQAQALEPLTEGAALVLPPLMMPYQPQSAQFGDLNFNPHMMCTFQCPFSMPNILLSMQHQQQQLQSVYQAPFNPMIYPSLHNTNNPYNLELSLERYNRRLKRRQRKNRKLKENNGDNVPLNRCELDATLEMQNLVNMSASTIIDNQPIDFHNNKHNLNPDENETSKILNSLRLDIMFNGGTNDEALNDQESNGDEESFLIDSSYDPFLAAKRQLEELCAPDSPPNNDTRFNTKTLSTPTTPSPKMTTSLTLGSTITPATPTLPSPLTPNLNKRRLNNATTPIATNFRRTSSLRGPRRSPLLSARPLFAQKRPTIQRGLSDEGPISTNFLKSEEYDEMPVRSVCVNDFAITNSPRVVRRDTSLSNRKNSFKLSFNNNGTREASPSGGSFGGGNASDSGGVHNERLTAPKELSKTDSLAVFLKYEKELEKLAIGSGSDTTRFPWEIAGNGEFNNTETGEVLQKNASQVKCNNQFKSESLQTKPDNSTPSNSMDTTTGSAANSKLAFTKELKDKSNTLSKQNSAKSLKLDNEDVESNKPPQPKESQKLTLEPLLSPSHFEQNKPQIRLQPIDRSSQIPHPVSNLTTKRPQTSLPPLSHQLNVTAPTIQNVNFEPIFNNPKPQPQKAQQRIQPTISNNAFTYDKENKASKEAISLSTEYIDPKLINKCDNLPVKLADLKCIDSDSSIEPQLQQNQQQRCDRATDPYEHYVGPVSQLGKLLPISNKTRPANPSTRNAQTQSTPKHLKTTATTTQQPDYNAQQQLPAAVASNNGQRRNSIESYSSSNCRNPLKRKMRLGRNQFLYDASPEALDVDSACSADDEANPRSSAEYSPQLQGTFEQMFHQQALHIKTNELAPPPPPIFDDFDFDEFLSSFENDEEDFPIFRDCREFLKNRNNTMNKQRTAPTTTSQRNASTPKPIPQTQSNSSNFFQFPTLDRNLPRLVTSTPSYTRRSSSKHSIQGLKDMLLNDMTTGNTNSNDFGGDAHSKAFSQSRTLKAANDDEDNIMTDDQIDNSQKREIFISIETEQSDEMLDRNAISPNSLRNMVGVNTQTLVEVEVDGNDNKFSKISDDDDNNGNNVQQPENVKNAGQTEACSDRLLPNVQLNNAKNLMQQAPNAERRDDRHPQQQQRMKHSQNGGSGVSAGDSDEMSSLDGYPLGSNGSFRRNAGVASKNNVDSAYGSLSRQRSNEAMGKPAQPRNSVRTRPATAAANMTAGGNTNGAATHMQQKQFLLQQQYQQQQQTLQQHQQLKYAQAMIKGARSRQLSASSSSSSDNSLPPILVANSNQFQQQQQQQFLLQQQQQMSQLLQQNKACNRASPTANNYTTAMDMLNANHSGMLLNSTATFPVSMTSTGGATAKPMSRFCHECGTKFLIEQAKFCMDCGVKRLMI